MPLFRFVDCAVDDNLQALIIPGQIKFFKPTEQELRDAWTDILQQSSEAGGSHEYRLYVNLYKELSIIQLTLDQILITIRFLNKTYNKYLCDELNKLVKMKFEFNPDNPEQYQEDLERAYRLSKGLKIRYDLKKQQFEAIEKKFKEGDQAPTREYFCSMLITLSDHAKYPVTDQITVGEYYERIKRFNQYVDSTMSDLKKKKK